MESEGKSPRFHDEFKSEFGAGSWQLIPMSDVLDEVSGRSKGLVEGDTSRESSMVVSSKMVVVEGALGFYSDRAKGSKASGIQSIR